MVGFCSKILQDCDLAIQRILTNMQIIGIIHNKLFIKFSLDENYAFPPNTMLTGTNGQTVLVNSDQWEGR